MIMVTAAATLANKNFAHNVRVEIPFSDFLRLVQEGVNEEGVQNAITRVMISGDRLDFLLNGHPAFTRTVRAPPEFLFFFER